MFSTGISDIVRGVSVLIYFLVMHFRSLADVTSCAAKRCRNAWSMKLRVQDQEEDQRGPGERLYERTVKHVN